MNIHLSSCKIFTNIFKKYRYESALFGFRRSPQTRILLFRLGAMTLLDTHEGVNFMKFYFCFLAIAVIRHLFLLSWEPGSFAQRLLEHSIDLRLVYKDIDQFAWVSFEDVWKLSCNSIAVHATGDCQSVPEFEVRSRTRAWHKRAADRIVTIAHIMKQKRAEF